MILYRGAHCTSEPTLRELCSTSVLKPSQAGLANVPVEFIRNKVDLKNAPFR
jgi:hypothetical protein